LIGRGLVVDREVTIPVGRDREIAGNLRAPPAAGGLVVFAHGSGSSRMSPRNRRVADALHAGGLATLLIDLLTANEEIVDRRTAELRFDIPLLAARLTAATEAAREWEETRELPIAYFGASTGAAAALVAAARLPEEVDAIVSRGGRPDLAGDALAVVEAPTLLIVGGADPVVIDYNREAMAQMRATTALEIIPGATHLFEEPGALDEVARLAREWFLDCLEEPEES
jgi:pimeloyl-ACP methyl ester carboxylesterase